jgi:hypothetical protein
VIVDYSDCKQIKMFNYQHMFGDGHAYPKDWSPNLQYLSNEADTHKGQNLVIGNSGLEWKVLLILCGIIGLKFQ